MNNSVSVRNRTTIIDNKDRDGRFRTTLIETLRWYCSEIPEDELQSSIESLFSCSQRCSVLNCAVVDDSAEHILNETEHDASAVEVPYFSEFSETSCSLAQLDIPVFSLDGTELRVELRLSVKTGTDSVWQTILKEIGSVATNFESLHYDPEPENARFQTSQSHIEEDKNHYTMKKFSASEIATELTHSLRNPLGAIIAAVDLVASSERDKLSQENRGLLGLIESEAQRAETILKNYVELIHEPDVHLEKVDLVEFIRKLVESDTTGSVSIAERMTGQINVMLDPYIMARALTFLIGKVRSISGQSCAVVVGCSRMESAARIEMEYFCDSIRPERLRKVVLPFDTTRDGGSGLGCMK